MLVLTLELAAVSLTVSIRRLLGATPVGVTIITPIGRFPRPSRLEKFCRFPLLPDQLLVGETLSYDLGKNGFESKEVARLPGNAGFAVVKAKSLFVNVAEQVEGLNADIGAMDATLQETPEVFRSVGVNLPVNIRYGVVNHLMGEVVTKTLVRLQGVAVQLRSDFNVLADQIVKFWLATRCYYLRANLSAALQNRRNNRLALSTSTSDLACPFVGVHVAGLAADESFINFDFASQAFRQCRVLHRKANPVKHEPRGFLGDADSAVNLPGANPILRSASIQTAGSHLSRPIGESSKTVPALMENCFRHLEHFQIRRVFRNIGTRYLRNAGKPHRSPSAIDHFTKRNIGIGVVFDRFKECLWACVP